MKIRIYAALLSLMMIITASGANAAGKDDKGPGKEKITAMTNEQKEARMEAIRDRVNEIRAMDRSTLSRADRKTLKKELKEMNKEARAIKGGIYLSVGAVIVIIILLIILL